MTATLDAGPLGLARTPDFDGRGACAGYDPELFFPLSMANQDKVAVAKAVCQGCGVRDACLQWALEVGDEWAVLGGTTPAERRALKRWRP